MTGALRIPDRVLVDRLLNGDPEAADLMVTRFNGLVWAILVRDFRLPYDQRQDLFQELFVRLWEDGYRRVRMWSREGDFAAYLAPIVRHLALDSLRRRREEQLPEDGPDDEPRGDEPNPHELAWVREQRRALRQAVAGLAEQDRELYRLRYKERASYREISDTLGITVNNVGVRLARLTDRLRNTVAECVPAPAGQTPDPATAVRLPRPGSSPE